MQKISFWWVSTLSLACLLFGASLRWAYIDQSPPMWDESVYLLQATVFYKTIVEQGLIAFLQQIVHLVFDPERVIFVPLIVQPFFLIFGPSLDVAMAVVNLFWFVTAWAIYGLTKNIAGQNLGERAGFFAFALFSFYHITTFLTTYFYLEFPLVSIICASQYALLRFYISRNRNMLWLAGLFIGIGMMTKVTFPVFVLSCIVLFLFELRKSGNIVKTFQLLSPIFIVPLIIAGPYYLYYFKKIVKSVKFLSSSQLANLYGYGPAFSFRTIFEFWGDLFLNPTMLITGICSLFLLIAFFVRMNKFAQRGAFPYCMLSIWFIVPFAIASFATIKEIRYVYPALVPLFILAGVVISWLSRFHIGLPLVILLYFLPIGQFLVANGVLSQSFIPSIARIRKYNVDPPDSRDWKVGDVVVTMGRIMETRGLQKNIFLIGGNRYYHKHLLLYYGIIGNQKFNYNVLPFFETNPINSAEDALNFIMKTPHSAILYKTGSNYPECFTKFDSEILSKLKSDTHYESVDLGIEQPDGSRFFLLIAHRAKS